MFSLLPGKHLVSIELVAPRSSSVSLVAGLPLPIADDGTGGRSTSTASFLCDGVQAWPLQSAGQRLRAGIPQVVSLSSCVSKLALCCRPHLGRSGFGSVLGRRSKTICRQYVATLCSWDNVPALLNIEKEKKNVVLVG